ncbi:hypothetical protein DPMN_039207 [Dreissena polymorpha]|uniref:Uncharacterized protein n=1 Tax=Dreissena polymorpha TaxID=45954 RepID=A0A9D4MFL2_DREPO|nr:hypothetical protein DPMN_039207 [Dreissena polymorpha]
MVLRLTVNVLMRIVFLAWIIVVSHQLEIELVTKPENIVDGTNVTIRCLSSNNLEMDFTSRDQSTIKIGRCSVRSCYLYDDSLKGRYSIENTTGGALLTILSITNYTYGRYMCFETFNHSISESVIVSPGAVTGEACLNNINVLFIALFSLAFFMFIPHLI